MLNLKTASMKAAFDIAKKAHKGQKRRNDEPYINHIIRVAENFNEIPYGIDYINDGLYSQLIILSLLHDVQEDHPSYEQEIKREFGRYTHSQLLRLTRVPNQTYAEYLDKMVSNISSPIDYQVLLVKLADLKDNLNNNCNKSQVNKYEIARLFISKELKRNHFRYYNIAYNLNLVHCVKSSFSK